MSKYICDCGKTYADTGSLEYCQATNHGIPLPDGEDRHIELHDDDMALVLTKDNKCKPYVPRGKTKQAHQNFILGSAIYMLLSKESPEFEKMINDEARKFIKFLNDKAKGIKNGKGKEGSDS